MGIDGLGKLIEYQRGGNMETETPEPPETNPAEPVSAPDTQPPAEGDQYDPGEAKQDAPPDDGETQDEGQDEETAAEKAMREKREAQEAAD